MTITLRTTKGSALTHAELDGNFSDLDARATSASAAVSSLDTRLDAVEPIATSASAAVSSLDTRLDAVEPIAAGAVQSAGLSAELAALNVVTATTNPVTGGIEIPGIEVEVGLPGSDNAAGALSASIADTNSASMYQTAKLTGVHKVSSSVELLNDTVLKGRTQGLTYKSRIYAGGNFPILQRSSGYQSRMVIDDVLFHGQTDGNYSGSTNSNTSPLIYLQQGGAYFHANRAAFMRGTIGIKVDKALNLVRFSNCNFNNMTDKGAHLIGARHALFQGCGFENSGYGVYAEPSLVVAGVGDTTGSQKVIIRDCYTETANFFLDCAVPEVTGCFFYNTTITIGKSATNPKVKANSSIYNNYLVLPPKLNQDVEFYGVNAANAVSQEAFTIPALTDADDVTGGYVAADGLDYFVVSRIKPNTTYTQQSATVSFKRDAVVTTSDVVTLITSSNTQDNSGGRMDLAPTTYGVIENTGAAMYVTLTGAAGDTVQRTVYLQSLIKNGTFQAGATTNWFATGSPTTSHDGTYMRITGTTTSDMLSYNKLAHYPIGTEVLLAIARVKAGSTGNFGLSTMRCGVYPNFFNNGDGTFDDLWVNYMAVKKASKLGKAQIGFNRRLPDSSFDAYVKWCALVPLVGGAIIRKVYSEKFTYDAPSIAAGASTTTLIMSDGSTTNDFKQASVGDLVRIIPTIDTLGLNIYGWVSAVGQITMKLVNPTAAPIDLPSAVWWWELTKQ